MASPLTLKQRKRILALHRWDWSLDKIAEVTGHARSTVHNVITDEEAEGEADRVPPLPILRRRDRRPKPCKLHVLFGRECYADFVAEHGPIGVKLTSAYPRSGRLSSPPPCIAHAIPACSAARFYRGIFVRRCRPRSRF